MAERERGCYKLSQINSAIRFSNIILSYCAEFSVLFFASKLFLAADIVVADEKVVNLAENQMLRFPGNNEIENSQDTDAGEDARLLAMIANQDQSALAALYRRRGKLIYSTLFRMLANEMETQEIM